MLFLSSGYERRSAINRLPKNWLPAPIHAILTNVDAIGQYYRIDIILCLSFLLKTQDAEMESFKQ